MGSDHESAGAPAGAEAPTEIPERWSALRKTELVLRLMRGEPLDAVARESQVPAHELEEWRRVFVDRGTQGLKKRVDPDERELKRVQAKLGEVMMRLELAEGLLEKKVTVQGPVQIDPIGVPCDACRGPSDSGARIPKSA